MTHFSHDGGLTAREDLHFVASLDAAVGDAAPESAVLVACAAGCGFAFANAVTGHVLHRVQQGAVMALVAGRQLFQHL